MPKATGYSALAALTSFKATQWFAKSFASLVDEIALRYSKRNAINMGFFASAGGIASNTVAQVSWTAGAATLDGWLEDGGATTNYDPLGPGSYLVAIMSNGSPANITLVPSAFAYITGILINSNGTGGSDGASSLGGPRNLFLAVIAGTGTSPVATAHLTTAEINAALAASAGNLVAGVPLGGDHSGATGWCHIARAVLDEAASTLTVEDNRNNVLGV